MVDRIKFLKSIDQKEMEFVTTVVSFFDQFMALYSLIGTYDYTFISINTEETGNNTISFDVNLTNPNDVNQLLSIIMSFNNQMIMYERVFRIKADPLTDLSVRIVIY